MKSVSRTRTVYINSVVTLLSQILQVVLGFVIRKLFLTYIGVEYLGYNSVFLNILQLLNLADLGIGVAVTSFLYKPLATNNTNAISALMYIYKRLYTIIGIFVLVIGLAIIPFLSILVPDAKCSFGYLVLIYLINLAGTVSTYFLAYKRTLIIADQKLYIANITDTILFFVAAVLQLIGMKLFPSYVVYILINMLRNIISNIVLSLRADHIYGRLYRNVDKSYVKEYQPQIFAYIKDVFISRIGAVIYYSTDNVILSVIRGSLLTGYLSNYTLITTQLNTVVVQILSSLQATFGNYISMNKDVDEQRKMADNYFCANYIIGNFCFICFSLLVQPFIELVFGAGMLLGFSTALWLGINLMLTFLIQLPSQVFTIYKLFRYDRFIILISATLNILISIVLGKKIGLNGVLIGTFVTSLIYLFSRFFVISKYVYKISYLHYIKKILFYGLSSVISFSVSFFVLKNFKGIAQYGVTGFGFKTILVAIMSILSTVMLLCKTREMDFLISKVTHDKFSASKVKLMVVFSTIIIVILSIIRGQLSNNENLFLLANNKSYQRTDSYVDDNNEADKVIHLSFDDVIGVFEELKEKDPNSIFELNTFGWLKDLHEKYGTTVSCYVFYEDGDFNLSQVSGKYKDEFIQNSDWLRFGFHTKNASTDYIEKLIVDDYSSTINELERIVGSESIDNFIRLHMFQCTYEEIQKLTTLKYEPVTGLFTADDNRQSYYLSGDENSYIYSHEYLYDEDLNIWFASTDMRIEYIDNIKTKIDELSTSAWNNQRNCLIIFTHEWALDIENKKKIETFFQYAIENGYTPVFLEDVLCN